MIEIKYARKALGISEDEHLNVLVGNPNVGKSVVFSALTGKYREVSNYPGTTVEVSMGDIRFGRETESIIDTPGADSLTPISEDEKVARDILLGSDPDRLIQVADAKNLTRTLMFLLQLSELGVPMVLDLNMVDEAKARLIEIDTQGLSEELGIPIVETVAPERRGIKRLKAELKNASVPSIKPTYHPKIEKAIDELADILGSRGVSVLYISAQEEMNDFIIEKFGEERKTEADKILSRLHHEFSRDISYLIRNSLRKKAQRLSSKYMKKKEVERTSFKNKLSALTMKPITGVPIFIGVLLLLYTFVGYVGAQLAVDFIEVDLFGNHINPFITEVTYEHIGNNFVSEILVGKYGVITVGLTWAIALILPLITTFFLAFSILEDVGYIPRLAAMADKGFRKVGLNGKAVLPMVLGFGCDTMATLTTRVLDTKKERVIATTMLALGIPCSAQLGVIFAIMTILPIQYFALWVIVIASQLLLVAWLASKILPGGRGDFIMELPPLRVPKWDNVLRKTYYKVMMFFKEAVPLFILGTFIISVANITGVLDLAIDGLRPIVVHWMGLPSETSVAFLLGFLRRDFGAVSILDMSGEMMARQVLVATVAITLFVPCIANLLIIIKERGIKTALGIIGFIIPFAFFVAGVLNHTMKFIGGLL
ncbi:MAG: ferrous iron transport protein B [Thermoplasmata archaeon]